METYYLKRYLRAGPGQTTGTLTDRIKFTAENAAEAETSGKRKFFYSAGKMNWERDFALLEDATGKIIAHWFDEASVA
jgi:hypothetical protein